MPSRRRSSSVACASRASACASRAISVALPGGRELLREAVALLAPRRPALRRDRRLAQIAGARRGLARGGDGLLERRAARLGLRHAAAQLLGLGRTATGVLVERHDGAFALAQLALATQQRARGARIPAQRGGCAAQPLGLRGRPELLGIEQAAFDLGLRGAHVDAGVARRRHRLGRLPARLGGGVLAGVEELGVRLRRRSPPGGGERLRLRVALRATGLPVGELARRRGSLGLPRGERRRGGECLVGCGRSRLGVLAGIGRGRGVRLGDDEALLEPRRDAARVRRPAVRRLDVGDLGRARHGVTHGAHRDAERAFLGQAAVAEPGLHVREPPDVEELAQEPLALVAAGVQEAGEAALRQQDDLAELLPRHPQQVGELARRLVVARGEHGLGAVVLDAHDGDGVGIGRHAVAAALAPLLLGRPRHPHAAARAAWPPGRPRSARPPPRGRIAAARHRTARRARRRRARSTRRPAARSCPRPCARAGGRDRPRRGRRSRRPPGRGTRGTPTARGGAGASRRRALRPGRP